MSFTVVRDIAKLPVKGMIRSTVLLGLLLLGACSSPQIQSNSGPDIKRDCARLIAIQGIPDQQMSGRLRELIVTILKRENLDGGGKSANKSVYAFRFCRAYLGLPLGQVRVNPQKNQTLDLNIY